MVGQKNACCLDTPSYFRTPTTIQKLKKLPKYKNEVDTKLSTEDWDCEMTKKQNLKL